eukprot:TRINITY_DN8433_c0_g1_i2.p1 TRINITY_DN8433_c0_g1~~TRINITY_DN8433_c0_g1_i2.p1  ORF type:complete len:119 (-),score=17.62 TRINITY_DN8433_c0_g1_i2:531-887(-)
MFDRLFLSIATVFNTHLCFTITWTFCTQCLLIEEGPKGKHCLLWIDDDGLRVGNTRNGMKDVAKKKTSAMFYSFQIIPSWSFDKENNSFSFRHKKPNNEIAEIKFSTNQVCISFVYWW